MTEFDVEKCRFIDLHGEIKFSNNSKPYGKNYSYLGNNFMDSSNVCYFRGVGALSSEIFRVKPEYLLQMAVIIVTSNAYNLLCIPVKITVLPIKFRVFMMIK